MAVEQQQQKTKRAVVDKWKKKKRFTIMGPKSVGNIELGETISEKPELLVNRVVKVNMGMTLNLLKKKHIDLSFKVRNVQGSNANTELVGYEEKASYLKRLFRRRSSKIEVVNFLTSKDGKRIKVKAVIVTMRKVENQKCKDARRILEAFLQKTVKANTAEAFMTLLIQKELLDELLPELKKVVLPKKAEVEMVRVMG